MKLNEISDLAAAALRRKCRDGEIFAVFHEFF